MRRTLIVLAITLMVVIASFAMATVASANAGPHGGYDIQTGKCASCHRIHTAISNDGFLLKEPSIYELCVSCHGGTTVTNVVDGVVSGTSNRLNGGGFVNYATPPTAAASTTWGANATVTSRHDVEGIPLGGGLHATGVGTAWGGASSGAGIQGTLECTSCHNPHGSVNYRILNDNDSGRGPFVNEDSAKWVSNSSELLRWNFTVVSTATQYVTDTGSFTTGIAQVPATADDSVGGINLYSVGTTANYTGGMRMFCSTCHKSYLTASGARSQGSLYTGENTGTYFPGTQDAGDGWGDAERYRHTTSRAYTSSTKYPLRLGRASTAAGAANSQFTCLTCHMAHGTAAAETDGAVNIAPTMDSALMYYDNRGVCNACHMKTK